MIGRILLLCSVVLLSSCSARWHAKQALKHIEKAKELDSTISLVDTVVLKRDTVIEQPPIEIDTLVDLESPTDTAEVVVDDVKIKTTYDPIKKKQWIKVDKPIKKDTITVKDTVVKETIVTPPKKSKPWYKDLPLGVYVVAMLLGLIFIGSLFRKIFG